MKYQVTEILEKVPTPSVLPDGIHFGLWSGNSIDCQICDKCYTIKTAEGIRGRANVTIEVKEGVVTFSQIKLENKETSEDY